ncbi:MAG: anaerobic ribonucleoside-triphosphate reductase [Candidatus Hydrothermarchaeales archaeon]
MASKPHVKIVKSSGDLAIFDPNVIRAECVEAGIDSWTANDAALEVMESVYDGISTTDIQVTLEKVLAEKSPGAAERYRRFHSMLVRTSRNTIEPFDRKKIASSLVKETRLPEELADNIAKESEEELRRLKLDFISAPLIREVVNVKLLEHGFEDARADYTRLGMPVYDAAHLIETGKEQKYRSPQALHDAMADNVLLEYALLKVLPLHQADAHMRGEIHVHKLEHFVTRPYSFRHDLRRLFLEGLTVDSPSGKIKSNPAKDAVSALSHVGGLLDVCRSYFSGPQSLDNLNYFLAPFINGLKKEEVAQLSRLFLYTTIQRRIETRISFSHQCPDNIARSHAIGPHGKSRGKYSDYHEEAQVLQEAFTDVLLEGDGAGNKFPYVTPLYNLEKAWTDDYETSMIPAHELAIKFGMPVFVAPGSPSEDMGALQKVSLNIPRVAYEATEEAKFYEILDDRLAIAREVIMVKRDVIKKRLDDGMLPFLNDGVEEPRYTLDDVTHEVGFFGINEAVKVQTGHELHESNDSWKFGLNIVRHIYKSLKEWSEETQLKWTFVGSTENAVRRLAKLDYGQFSNKAVIGDQETPSYNEACSLSSLADLTPIRRLQMEGAFHPYCEVVANAPPSSRSATALMDFNKKIMEDTELGQWKFGVDIDG